MQIKSNTTADVIRIDANATKNGSQHHEHAFHATCIERFLSHAGLGTPQPPVDSQKVA